MIDVFIKGQELRIVTPIIASGTINYLELKAHFETDDWDDVDEIFAIFEKDNSAYQIKLNNSNIITKDKGLNLKSGVYKVHFVGKTIYNDDVYSRITTERKDIVVIRSGELSGEEFPNVNPSERDEILKIIGNLSDLKTSDKSSIVNAINEIFSSQLKPEISIEKDWDENNPESPYFIKNRTHYVDGENVHKLDNKFLNIDKNLDLSSNNPVSNSAVAPLGEKIATLQDDFESLPTYTAGEGISISEKGVISLLNIGNDSSSVSGENFRLINKITTTEEMHQIIVDKDINGNTFEVKEMIAFVTGYSSSGIIAFSSIPGFQYARIKCPGYNQYVVNLFAKYLVNRFAYFGIISTVSEISPNICGFIDEAEQQTDKFSALKIEQFNGWDSINFPAGLKVTLYGR